MSNEMRNARGHGRHLAALMSGLLLCCGIAHAQQLHLGESVVVEFGAEAGLEVHGTLETAAGVVLTGIGAASGGTTAEAWPGLFLGSGSDAVIDGLTIRFAEQGLSVASGEHVFTSLTLEDNTSGLLISGNADILLNDGVFQRNGTAVRASDDALVRIHNTSISGNDFGIENAGAADPVDARENWWGHPDGPQATDNPSGSGDPVSDGVDYADFLAGTPLRNCSAWVADGNYQVSEPQVTLGLACENAVEVRASEDETLADATYGPMMSELDFMLSPGIGSKQIYVQFRAQEGHERRVALPEPVEYDPDAPQVEILQPEDGVVVTEDIWIIAAAEAADGIDHVEFRVGSQYLGEATEPPYEKLWDISGWTPGDYEIRVRAIGMLGDTSEAMHLVHLQPAGVDPAAPVISDVVFAGEPLVNEMVVEAPGTLAFRATAPSGVVQASIAIDGVTFTPQRAGDEYSAWVDFEDVANGPREVVLSARNGFGIDTVETISVEVDLQPPPAPEIVSPAGNVTVTLPDIVVSGHAQPGSDVQLYLDDAPASQSIRVNSSGNFTRTLVLPAEGTSRIAADASNSRGTGPLSEERWVTWAPAGPEVQITSPVEGAVLDQDAEVAVAAVDPLGIDSVVITLDGVPMMTLDRAPWTWVMPISTVADGTHELGVTVTNVTGRTGTDAITIVVEKLPPPPPPVLTPYVGSLVSLQPKNSYGEESVHIAGKALARDGGEAVADASLQVVLKNRGHERRINVATDAQGQFVYNFQPGSSDQGIYAVSVRHPDQSDPDWQDEFVIDRVAITPTTYRLHAARTVAATIPLKVSASEGNGVSGFYFAAKPQEQPSGALPPGITIVAPDAVNLAGGANRNLSVSFLADNTAPESGTIVLTAYAQGTGATVRGRVSVPYRLSEPVPALRPQPTSFQSGLARGEQSTATVTLSNDGLLLAEGITLELFGPGGQGAAPEWVTLASPATIEELPVGGSTAITLSVRPGSNVPDGIHHANLYVTADNATALWIPVVVSVTESGEGGVRFHAIDIYTETEDEEGNLIPGLAGAVVKVQHETIPSIMAQTTTDAAGIGVIESLPAGRYSWRASAPDHVTATGRVHIQPGVETDVQGFLDIDLIIIDWEVVETTIEDEYDVVVDAEYETEVPAPVLLIEPNYINLPPMQEGEEVSGTLTVSNYGLIRADNIEVIPPPEDAFVKYEFLGEIPTSLDARDRFTFSWKATAKQPLVSARGVSLLPQGQRSAAPLFLQVDPQSGGMCHSYESRLRLVYTFECSAGVEVGSEASCRYGRHWGSQCGGSGSSGGAGGGGGGSGGGGTGGPIGGGSSPLSGSPGCTPNCKKCCTDGSSSGG